MKKIIKIILILTLSSAMLFANISAVFADYTVGSFKDLNDIFAGISEGAEITINLSNTIEIEQPLEINVPCKITIKGGDKIELQTDAIQVFCLNAAGIEMYFHDVTIEDISGSEDGPKILEYEGDGQVFYINGDGCIIDGANCFKCGSQNAKRASTFKKTFTNYDGGAIYINAEDCRIRNCSFTACFAQSDGGAIYIDHDGNIIQNCTFTSCGCVDDGGAIFCSTGVDDVVIDKCKFEGNHILTENESSYGKNVYGRGDTLIVGAPYDQQTDEWFYDCEFTDNWSGSILSAGSIVIVAAGVVAVAAAVIIVIRKKRPA